MDRQRVPEARKHEWRWQAREQRRVTRRTMRTMATAATVTTKTTTTTARTRASKWFRIFGGGCQLLLAHCDVIMSSSFSFAPTYPVDGRRAPGHHSPGPTPSATTNPSFTYRLTSDKAKQYLSCSRPLPLWIEVPVPPTATHNESNSAWQSVYQTAKSAAPNYRLIDELRQRCDFIIAIKHIGNLRYVESWCFTFLPDLFFTHNSNKKRKRERERDILYFL